MLKKEYPLDMKSKDLKIDTMNCTLSTLVMNGMIETEMKEYLGTGAAPSATFKAPDVEALNILLIVFPLKTEKLMQLLVLSFLVLA